jgi:hypothetical protein
MDDTAVCIYCGGTYPLERAQIGKQYCFARECQRKGLSVFSKDWRLILVPKQGFMWVRVDSPDLYINNKSSGR